jgi:5-(carboxyamino)imidazole ribonucleotide synthase
VKKVAIVGGGQLGLMLGEAGRGLDVECRFLDPANMPPAARVGEVIRSNYDDADALAELAGWADVLTYEFENVPVDAVAALEDRIAVCPPPLALRKAQDRLDEKRLFESLDIPTSPFRNIESDADVNAAAEELGLPLVFKTRRFGYDGKGQAVAHKPADLEGLWSSLGEVPLIAEQFVDFEREVSIIGARSVSGDVVHYPLSENRHSGGILRVSIAPYDDPELHALACAYHRRMLDELGYVGVLALEMFVVGDRLVANEFAPRVHNSGHWTIEGARTSQFENHLRAILDMPLGDPSPVGKAAMINVIGDMPDQLARLADADCHLHDYGKAPRPGRKLAHITLVQPTRAALEAALAELRHVLPGD